MSSLIAEGTEQRWSPTHVQVTVLRARGLRGKGKHGTSDVYTIIQVGKEKYQTGVAEKTTAPEWREECAFELQPGVLETDNGGRGVHHPPGSCDLTLTVMHRALIGLDVFLGQAVVPLDKAFRDNVCVKNEWYKLNSKTGKKEKERGDIQVTVTFTRNNLTASMYDLAVKDKSHSTFTKLKERMKGKKKPTQEDSASDILASGYGTLVRMRHRLPSDGGGEEEYEDDEGGEARRSKMRSYFLRGKLRKSSDTRSSTSLGSESSESSSRGGSLSPTAGISVVVSDLSNSPSNSSNLTADNSPDHTADTSPKLSPLHHGGHFDDDGLTGGEITLFVPQPFARLNGVHVQPAEEPSSGKPVLGNSLGLLQKSMPMSMSLQNLRPPRIEEELPNGPAGDGRRWSFDKAGDEEKAAIAAVLEQSPMLGFEDSAERLEQTESAANPPPPASSTEAVESRVSPGKKQRRTLFSHGKSEPSGKGQSQSGVEPQHAPTHTQEKQHKGGWFGSKDNKPSPVASPKLEPSTDHYSPHHPHLPSRPPSEHPWGSPAPPVDPASPGSPFHHTNPFSHSQTSPPPSLSLANPFFALPQCNPFFGDEPANRALTSVPPPLPYLSSSRPPISDLFPEHESNPNPALCRGQTNPEDPVALDKHKQRPLPPVPREEEETFMKELINPFTSSGAMELDAGWDADFELFTAGRLQSPTTPNGPQPEHCSNKGELLLTTDMNDALHPQNTCTEISIEAKEVTSQVINSVIFAQFPNDCMEGDNLMFAASADASAHTPELGVCLEAMSNHNTNANAATTSNANGMPCHDCDHMHGHSSPCPSPVRKLHNNSPNTCSSGIGSSAEDDVPTSLSPCSASEKFSASSSSEEAEFQTIDGTFHEECPEPTLKGILDGSESVNPVFNRSDVLSVLCDDASQFIQFQNGHDKEVQPSGSAGHGQLLEPQVANPPLRPTTVITEELGDDGTLCLSPNLPDISCPDLLPKPSVSLQSVKDHGKDFMCDFKEPQGDMGGFSEDRDYTLVENTKPKIPSIILDDENVAACTSFHMMTSSPCDNPSLKELPVSSIGLGPQNLSNGSPRTRPDQLFGDFLNTSYIGTSPDPGPGFDNSLLHTGVSDQSPGSLFNCSLYVSTDTQHYQSCLTHNSNASEEGVGKLGAGTLPSAYSAECGAEACDEVGEFQSVSVADTERIAALGLEDSTNECSQCDDESNQTGGLEMLNTERTVVLESCFTIGEDSGLVPKTMLSNALTDSHISSVSNDHDHFPDSPETERTTLQRSHSEGTMNIQSDSLHMPSSFGSDPVLSLLRSSSAQPVSDLLSPPLPASSSSSSLTAKSSFPSALSPAPLLPSGSARSPPSMALRATVPALCAALPAADAPHTALPRETWWQPASQEENSPHPVKPLTTATQEEKKTECRSVLEKLKSSIHPGRSASHGEQEAESKKSLTEGAGSYYHLNHSELVALLVQREAELQRRKAEFECQRALLAKREVELKKLKPQVRDLEDYIDTLLVRIMEQTPTLLQVGTKKK